jgi:hypothetical protein
VFFARNGDASLKTEVFQEPYPASRSAVATRREGICAPSPHKIETGEEGSANIENGFLEQGMEMVSKVFLITMFAIRNQK